MPGSSIYDFIRMMDNNALSLLLSGAHEWSLPYLFLCLCGHTAIWKVTQSTKSTRNATTVALFPIILLIFLVGNWNSSSLNFWDMATLTCIFWEPWKTNCRLAKNVNILIMNLRSDVISGVIFKTEILKIAEIWQPWQYKYYIFTKFSHITSI